MHHKALALVHEPWYIFRLLSEKIEKNEKPFRVQFHFSHSTQIIDRKFDGRTTPADEHRYMRSLVVGENCIPRGAALEPKTISTALKYYHWRESSFRIS